MVHHHLGRPSVAVWLLVLICFPVSAAHCQTIDIPTDTLNKPRQPQLAVTPGGKVHVVFGAEAAIYSSTAGAAKIFGPPVKIADVEGLMLGMRRGPRIAATDHEVVVTAIDKAGNLLAWKSSDGRKWEGPTQINDMPKSAREGLQHLAIGPNGELFAVWLDDRGGGKEVYGATSTDAGKSWNKNVQVYRSPDGSVCECCHPSTVFDAKGSLYVMWRNSLEGNRDLYIARSSNRGKTFSRAVKLGTGSWHLDHCPMDGGFLAVPARGTVVTVWRRDKQVILAVAGKCEEQLLGEGEQAWVATNPKGTWAVWLRTRPGELWLSKPGESDPIRLAGDAADPVIAAPVIGHGPVVIAWEARERGSAGLRASIIAE